MLIHYLIVIQHAISHFFGLNNLSGPFYGFWSGVGSDIGEYTVAAASVAGLATAWHHLNCHEDGCWRIGRMTTVEDNGHHYKRCKRHHLARHSDQSLTCPPV